MSLMLNKIMNVNKILIIIIIIVYSPSHYTKMHYHVS